MGKAVPSEKEHIITDSLTFAKLLGRKHFAILRGIRGVHCSDEFRELNFKQDCYIANGRTLVKYNLTTDGLEKLIAKYEGYADIEKVAQVFGLKHTNIVPVGVITDSLEIARIMRADHGNILRTIHRLACTDHFREINLIEAYYFTSQKIKRPKFNMTKDGLELFISSYRGPTDVGEVVKAFNLDLLDGLNTDVEGVVTDSLKVAKLLDKSPNAVLKDIRRLDCDNAFIRLNFRASYYVTSQKQKKLKYDITEQGLKLLLSRYRGHKSRKVAKLLGLDVVDDSSEGKFLEIIGDSFAQYRQIPQKKVGPYKIDLYFPDFKIAVEIDEPHHEHKTTQDEQRQRFIEKNLGCEFVRFRTHGPDSVGVAINKIMCLIALAKDSAK